MNFSFNLEQKSLILFVSIFSLLGSAFVIIMFVIFKNFKNFTLKIMIYLSISDLVISLCLIFAASGTIKDAFLCKFLFFIFSFF